MATDDDIVRLDDVAVVTLGAENYDFTTAFGGRNAVFIGIKVAPDGTIRASDRYLLVGGERRIRACESLGRTTIYAIVTSGDPDEVALIDNVQRASHDLAHRQRRRPHD